MLCQRRCFHLFFLTLLLPKPLPTWTTIVLSSVYQLLLIENGLLFGFFQRFLSQRYRYFYLFYFTQVYPLLYPTKFQLDFLLFQWLTFTSELNAISFVGLHLHQHLPLVLQAQLLLLYTRHIIPPFHYSLYRDRIHASLECCGAKLRLSLFLFLTEFNWIPFGWLMIPPWPPICNH